jgi:hypothetical protein
MSLTSVRLQSYGFAVRCFITEQKRHGNLRASRARVDGLVSIAPHVTEEFDKYNRCGILQHGFVRL